jgi:ankyrin repeat protein
LRRNIELQNNNGLTALMIASRLSQKEIVRFLIERGANINAICNKGDTSLIIAARNNKESIVRLLIKKGANLNIVSYNFNWTALMWACKLGYASIIEILIRNGAKTNIINNDGKKAYDILDDCKLIDDYKIIDENEKKRLKNLHHQILFEYLLFKRKLKSKDLIKYILEML